MKLNRNKENIIKDFGIKQTSYFRNNYGTITNRNYIRRLRQQLIIDEIDITQSYNHVLDVGCGPAILYPALLRNCEKYFAVDLVETNLDAIRKKDYENATCLLGDLDTFDWKDNYFDVIICSGMIEYTANPESNLEKLIRFLRKDGILICSFPNIISPYRLCSEYIYKHLSFTKKRLFKKEDVACYTRKLFSAITIKELLAGHSFKSMNVEYFGFKFIPQPFDSVLSSIDYKISRYCQDHCNNCLRRLCIEFLLTIKK